MTALFTVLAVLRLMALSAGTNPAVARSPLVLNSAGATLPAPLYLRWFRSYERSHPGEKFTYQPVGAGAGIQQYKSGKVDFAATDIPRSATELAHFSSPTLQIPTAAHAIVPVYNVPGVGFGVHFSGDVLADIFLGKITTWNDPRIQQQNQHRHLPAQPITVFHRTDRSAVTQIFTAFLSASNEEWKTRVGASLRVRWPVGLGGAG